MSNIKLKDHNWDTTGIYDSTLGKTQRQVNADLTANKVNTSDYSPETKTSEMTQSVGKDSSGKLWTTPASSATIVSATENWLSNNVDPDTGYVLDRSLSVANAAAPADLVGDLKSSFDKKSNINMVWARGAIGSSAGLPSSSTTRIRTSYYNNNGQIYKVIVPNDYKVAAFLYTDVHTDNYVGCWNGSSPIVGTLTWLQEIRVDAIDIQYIRFVVSKANGGAINVDEAYVCEFYEKTAFDLEHDISNISSVFESTGNLVEYTIPSATVDDSLGILIAIDGYKTTELIKLPKWQSNQVYNPFTTLYVRSYDGTSYGTAFTKVVFYSENMSVLSVIDSQSNITIPTNAEYVRVVFPNGNTYLYVGCGILEDEPTYKPYHKAISKEYANLIGDSIHNSDGAKTNIVKTALQYFNNNDFGYGNTHTAFSFSAEAVESDGVRNPDGTQSEKKCYEGAKYQIDCSGFTRLTMQCIYPQYSRHYGLDNIVPPWGYRYDEDTEYDTPQGRLTAHKQALYAYQRGYMYSLKSDYSNAEVGDLIFVQNSDPMWGGIGHSRIIANVIPLKSGENLITLFEASSDYSPPIIYGKSQQRPRAQYYACRLPLPYASNNIDAIGTASAANVQTTGTNGTVAEIHLSESTKDKEIYTIVFKATFNSSNNYAVVTGLGNDISFGNVLVYNDIHAYTVILPVDGSAGSNTVYIKSHAADSVIFGGAKIYKGFHTPTMSEFD